jgi:hypothetical protein
LVQAAGNTVYTYFCSGLVDEDHSLIHTLTYTRSFTISLIYSTVHILGNNVNKSKFYSGINSEQVEVRECLLLVGAESSVFQLAIQKIKDQHIQNYNFARCSVWVLNLVADIEGET